MQDGCWRKKVVQAVLAGELSKRELAEKLGITVRSIDRYLSQFRELGPEGAPIV